MPLLLLLPLLLPLLPLSLLLPLARLLLLQLKLPTRSALLPLYPLVGSMTQAAAHT